MESKKIGDLYKIKDKFYVEMTTKLSNKLKLVDEDDIWQDKLYQNNDGLFLKLGDAERNLILNGVDAVLIDGDELIELKHASNAMNEIRDLTKGCPFYPKAEIKDIIKKWENYDYE